MKSFRSLAFAIAAVCIASVSANEVRLNFDEMIDNLNKRRTNLRNECSLPESLVPKKLNDEFIIFDLDNFDVEDLSTRNRRNLRIEGNDLVATGNEKIFIKFPTDGHQPTAAEAGAYSGARITNGVDSDKVTSWYMYAFGGEEAEPYVDVKIGQSEKEVLYPAFGADGRSIIRVKNDKTLKDVFWSRFKTIASDPVGRVLLYRLLIEIRRCNEQEGAFEHVREIADLEERNKLRSINVVDSTRGCFSKDRRYIGVVPGPYTSQPTVVSMIKKEVPVVNIEIKSGKNTKLTWEVSTIPTAGGDTDYPKDISLFHEMLHWFHCLRAADRFTKENTAMRAPYGYPFDCYYGKKLKKGQDPDIDVEKQGEALGLWFRFGRGYEGEEVRTILGIPSTEKDELRSLMPTHIKNGKNGSSSEGEKFLNGDDLSENAYRLSRSGNGVTYKMRFGHTSGTIDGFDATMRGGTIRKNGLDQNAFKLAHAVAMNCYKDITGTEKKGWNLVPGEAAEDLAE